MKNKSEQIEYIDEIIECINSFYSENLESGIQKLPSDLSKYSGTISVMWQCACKLKEIVEEN